MTERSAGRSGSLAAMLAGVVVLIAITGITPPVDGQHSPSIAGIWLDNEGKASVDIQPCGGDLCGTVVWLRDPLDPKGRPWTDMLNPDTRKRSRPVCGLQIIGGLKPGDKGVWQNGWVYDPEEGKTFDLELSLKDAGTLTVFGFAGIRMLSETRYWKRLPPDSSRCKA